MKKKTKTPAYSAKPGQSETVTARDYTEQKNNLEDIFSNGFNYCDHCDLPDACEDFGCAIKTGVRKDYPIEGIF